MTNRISVIIPTLNAEHHLKSLLGSLQNQSLKIDEVIVVDSTSDDNTVALATTLGASVLSVERSAFDHGAARTLAGKKAKGDILVYLTQDVVLADNSSLEKLVRPFTNDETIGACCGRQLPYPDASPYAIHLRNFNYSSASSIKSYEDKPRYGIKTAFLSNSFAAYRKKALEKIGWFKEKMILGEDVYAGAKLLLSNCKLAYIADATTYHSHNYTVCQEFKRYFDIGVFHAKERWILEEFGQASGEGVNYIKSELSYLASSKQCHLIPLSLIRNGIKYIGYHMGRNYDKIPHAVVKKISMHSRWWNSTSG